MCDPGRRGNSIKISEENEDNTETKSASLDKIHGSSGGPKPKPDFKLSDFAQQGIFGPNGFLAALESHPHPNQSVSMSREASSSSMSVSKSKTTKKFKPSDSSDDVNEVERQVQGLSQETDPTQSLEEVVLDVSPEKAAFAIDHIREFVFHLLDEPTLFASRLVCHRWKYFASKELQKTITFTLRQANPPGRVHSGVQNDPKYSFIGVARNYYSPDPSRSISRLIDLLKNPTKSEFPCISINYWVSDWINPHSFFDTYGPYIKKLKLIPLISPNSNRPIIFKDFQQLLSTQAPNIEHLIFKGKVVVRKYKVMS